MNLFGFLLNFVSEVGASLTSPQIWPSVGARIISLNHTCDHTSGLWSYLSRGSLLPSGKSPGAHTGLGEDSLIEGVQKEMATHSSVLAWRIPGTGEPGGLPSLGLHRVGHDWSDLAAAAAADVSGPWSRLCGLHTAGWGHRLQTWTGFGSYSAVYCCCPVIESRPILCDPMD